MSYAGDGQMRTKEESKQEKEGEVHKSPLSMFIIFGLIFSVCELRSNLLSQYTRIGG